MPAAFPPLSAQSQNTSAVLHSNSPKFYCRKIIKPLIFSWQRLTYMNFLLSNIAREGKLSLLFVKVTFYPEVSTIVFFWNAA